MRLGDTLQARTGSDDTAQGGQDITAGTSGPNLQAVPTGNSLQESVTRAVRTYLDELDGQLGTDVYQMVLAEVEAPLLREIMHYTRNNQTKASRMLGLNRGTLRKKLKIYGFIPDSAD